MRKAMKAILSIFVALFVILAAGVTVLDFSGHLLDRSGWSNDGGMTRYLDSNGEALTGWQTIDKKTYYFDPARDGTLHTGWLEYEGSRYFLDPQGVLTTGWLETDETRYYLGTDGRMVTGWLDMESGRRYFGSDGIMVTGWLNLDTGRYYLDENGFLCYGWLDTESGRYYLSDQGTVTTGWLELEGNHFFLNADGTMATGWQDMPEGKCYLDENGILASGWLELDGNRYCLDENGFLMTGWADLEDGRYFLGNDGIPVTDWFETDGNRYYADPEGKLVTGWLTYEDALYYMGLDGAMSVGEVEIDGVSRFFTSQGKHVVLVNKWHPVPEDYVVELTEYGEYRIDASIVDALDRLLADCAGAGHSYSVNSIYRSTQDQQALWDERLARYIEEGDTEEDALTKVVQSVAVPGTSEHHLGLAADVGGDEAMYAWMRENSWKYGFIVRYPDGKTDYTGIIYEPWHIRYVGVELAKELYDLDLCMEEYMEMLTKE